MTKIFSATCILLFVFEWFIKLKLVPNERLKERILDPWITGGPNLDERPDLKRGPSDPSSYHVNRIFWGTQFHSICNKSDSFPAFLNISLVFLIFSLCVKCNTFFIGTSLPLFHSFIQRGFDPSSFESYPFLLCCPTKNPKILFAPQFTTKKHNKKHCIWNNKSKHQKFT